MVDVAPYHLESVAKGSDLALYVYDGDMRPVDMAGARADATVLAGAGTAPARVALTAAGANSLKGSGGFQAGSGTKVVVSLTAPGAKPVQARYDLGR